eukprot:GEZU01022639.1.p1 GENE.GEZU01022639.1~~GEZU01022639.1.p1  ORF type:complete len:212 (-),score=47.07 GEZU01022639.1:79-714(-)
MFFKKKTPKEEKESAPRNEGKRESLNNMFSVGLNRSDSSDERGKSSARDVDETEAEFETRRMTMYFWLADGKKWTAYSVEFCQKLEAARLAGQQRVDCNFGGTEYFIDFKDKRQYRKHDPIHHWRHISWREVDVKIKRPPGEPAPPRIVREHEKQQLAQLPALVERPERSVARHENEKSVELPPLPLCIMAPMREDLMKKGQKIELRKVSK